MATEQTQRVDKNWQQRELDQYSTEAILGTLAHYGVTTTAQAFTELAKTTYPISIAHQWHAEWKGKGQFLKFPVAAAEELWHRFLPGEVAPVDVALALINLMKTLDSVLGEKKPDGTLETRFKVVENYVAKLPAPSERRELFEVEVMYALGEEWAEVLDAMGAALAGKQKRAAAERLTIIEETLFPVRAGTARALMRAALGETAEAKADLTALGADASKDPDVKIAVVDALLDLKHLAEGQTLLLSLVAQADVNQDVERLSNLADRVSRLGGLLPRDEGRLMYTQFKGLIESLPSHDAEATPEV